MVRSSLQGNVKCYSDGFFYFSQFGRWRNENDGRRVARQKR